MEKAELPMVGEAGCGTEGGLSDRPDNRPPISALRVRTAIPASVSLLALFC